MSKEMATILESKENIQRFVCWRCDKETPRLTLGMCWRCYSSLWEMSDRRYRPDYYKYQEHKRWSRRKEKQHIYKKQYYEQNSEQIKQDIYAYRKAHPEIVRATALKYSRSLKKEFYDMLGGECNCAGENCWHQTYCGINHYWVLQAEHINGDGAEDKRQFKDRRAMRVYYLKHPEEARQKLRLFCANCNWYKMFKNKEFNQHHRKHLARSACFS